MERRSFQSSSLKPPQKETSNLENLRPLLLSLHSATLLVESQGEVVQAFKSNLSYCYSLMYPDINIKTLLLGARISRVSAAKEVPIAMCGRVRWFRSAPAAAAGEDGKSDVPWLLEFWKMGDG